MEAHLNVENAKSTTVPIRFQGLRILLVDPDTSNLLRLATILQEYSYQVTTTEQAAVALAIYGQHRDDFDAVMADADIADLDCYEFMNSIILIKDLPIILISSTLPKPALVEAMNRGACFCLIKPISEEQVKNIWQHICRKRNLLQIEDGLRSAIELEPEPEREHARARQPNLQVGDQQQDNSTEAKKKETMNEFKEMVSENEVAARRTDPMGKKKQMMSSREERNVNIGPKAGRRRNARAEAALPEGLKRFRNGDHDGNGNLVDDSGDSEEVNSVGKRSGPVIRNWTPRGKGKAEASQRISSGMSWNDQQIQQEVRAHKELQRMGLLGFPAWTPQQVPNYSQEPKFGAGITSYDQLNNLLVAQNQMLRPFSSFDGSNQSLQLPKQHHLMQPFQGPGIPNFSSAVPIRNFASQVPMIQLGMNPGSRLNNFKALDNLQIPNSLFNNPPSHNLIESQLLQYQGNAGSSRRRDNIVSPGNTTLRPDDKGKQILEYGNRSQNCSYSSAKTTFPSMSDLCPASDKIFNAGNGQDLDINFDDLENFMFGDNKPLSIAEVLQETFMKETYPSDSSPADGSSNLYKLSTRDQGLLHPLQGSAFPSHSLSQTQSLSMFDNISNGTQGLMLNNCVSKGLSSGDAMSYSNHLPPQGKQVVLPQGLYPPAQQPAFPTYTLPQAQSFSLADSSKNESQRDIPANHANDDLLLGDYVDYCQWLANTPPRDSSQQDKAGDSNFSQGFP